MTMIEKIRAEIERRYDGLIIQYSETNSKYLEGMMDILDDIRIFLDSLEK